MLKRFFRKCSKQETKKLIEQNVKEVREKEYERNKRLLCEQYFQQKELIKWQTRDLPCVTLETLDDCGLITISDTVVYLPSDALLIVKALF